MALTLFATFADLHVRKVATFANLHSYTHAYCSFVLLNEAQWNVSGSHCAHAWLIWLFGFSIRFTGKKIQRVEKKYFQNWCPNSSALQNNVAHRGFVRDKQRVKCYKSCLHNLSGKKWSGLAFCPSVILKMFHCIE